MKNRKYGFTLAEVLITLGIIGVVAAMSAPALIQHASAAKTGPAMSRAISALSNGMQAFLFANDANKINQSSPVAKKSNELLKKMFDAFLLKTLQESYPEALPHVSLPSWDPDELGD